MQAADDHGDVAGEQSRDQTGAGHGAEKLGERGVGGAEGRDGADEEQVQADSGIEEGARYAARVGMTMLDVNAPVERPRRADESETEAEGDKDERLAIQCGTGDGDLIGRARGDGDLGGSERAEDERRRANELAEEGDGLVTVAEGRHGVGRVTDSRETQCAGHDVQADRQCDRPPSIQGQLVI